MACPGPGQSPSDGEGSEKVCHTEASELEWAIDPPEVGLTISPVAFQKLLRLHSDQVSRDQRSVTAD